MENYSRLFFIGRSLQQSLSWILGQTLQVLAVAENLGVLTVLVVCGGSIQFRQCIYLFIYLFLLVFYLVTHVYLCMHAHTLFERVDSNY